MDQLHGSIYDRIVVVDVVLILVKKNLKCFISLCKTSISCSIVRLYCTFSPPVIILCNTFQFHQ